ncbi:MAG: acetyl-coenzyme A synthetase N-terminal domain-containing protein, partial [Parahaliea sp.]
MSEFPLHKVPASFSDAHINAERYREMYRRSIDEPEVFWAGQASQFLSWDKPWDRVVEADFLQGKAEWFGGGRLNVSVNCIDRHLPARADQTAFIWEGDDPAESRHITYGELKSAVCKLANVLRERGVKKGD